MTQQLATAIRFGLAFDSNLVKCDDQVSAFVPLKYNPHKCQTTQHFYNYFLHANPP